MASFNLHKTTTMMVLIGILILMTATTPGELQNNTGVSEADNNTTADGISTSGSGNSATTVSASDASGSTDSSLGSSDNSSKSSANDGSTTASSNPAGGSGGSSSNTDTSSTDSSLGSSDNSSKSSANDGSTTASSNPAGGSGGSSSNTDTTTGPGSSSGNNSDSSSSASEPVFTALVDDTSVNGRAVLVSITAAALPDIKPYKDNTTDEYAKFSKATSKITSTLKGTSESAKITGSAELKQIAIVDTATVRAEYLTPAADGINVPQLQTAINNLNKKEVFNLDSSMTTKVETVPLAAKYRWSSCTFKITNKAYTADLADPSTDAFKTIKNAVEPSLKKQLKKKVAAVREVFVMELLKGSVIVRTSVETDATSTNATTTDLTNALNTIDTVGKYNLDPTANKVSREEYIAGAQVLNPVPKADLPTPSSIPTRDNEDIKKGDVTMNDDKVRFVPTKKINYFLTVTIPAFAAVLLVIIIFLCCTTSDSFLCKICSADPKNVA